MAMSRKNVEVVRRLIEEAFDLDSDQLLAFWDPHGDYYPVEKFPESRPCHGVKEIAGFLREYRQAWEHYEMRIEAITPVSDDRVFVRMTLAAVGQGSGLNLQGELFQCFWLRHGRIFRQEDHLTLRGALRALGLSGQTLEAVGLRE